MILTSSVFARVQSDHFMKILNFRIKLLLKYPTVKIFQALRSHLSLLILLNMISFCVHAGTSKMNPQKVPKGKPSPTSLRKIPVIQIKKIPTPPFLDGIAIDECWKNTPVAKISLTNGKTLLPVYLKTCTDGRKIYILIQYRTAQKSRKHQI